MIFFLANKSNNVIRLFINIYQQTIKIIYYIKVCY